MPVSSTTEYIGESRDVVEKFDGKQLVYVSWDHHQLFAASFLICVPPETRFADLVSASIAPLIAQDPDAAKIAWDEVEWLLGNAPFTPDFDQSLADNGIVHKASLRMRTPALNSVCGSAA